MKKLWLCVGIAFWLAGCQPQARDDTDVSPSSIAALSGQPVPVELSALAANPTVYEGAYIQLSGQYARLPRLVCESNPHPSPATWGLASDKVMALAGRLDAQLRPLLPEGLTMTAAGRWQHWEGVVGCGDSAQPQDIWYLEVSHIISPSPITQVTLTPGGVAMETEATAVAQTDPSDSPEEATAVSPTPPTSQPTNPAPSPTVIAAAITTPTPTVTATDATAAATATPQSATATQAAGTATATASPTPAGQSTPTPSATPLPGTTPTPMPTQGPSATPSSTPVLNSINKGDIDPESLAMDSLGTAEKHQWTFFNEVSNNKLTINTMAADNVDLAISIVDPSGALLVSQNNAPAGQPETVSNLNMPQEGDYQIMLWAANGAVGDYALVALDDLSYPLPFDVVAYNNPISTSFTENIEQFWFFTGGMNDLISITAVPNSAADIGIEFIGPDAVTLEDLDLGGEGETETLIDYSLPDSGLYVLWLFGSANGTITVNLAVTKN